MTVKHMADQFGLWPKIEAAAAVMLLKKGRAGFLADIAAIPVHKSRATRRLGVYVSRGRKAVCIRLQFAQEAESLCQTFLHEVAHACDHLSRRGWREEYRQAHGDSWKRWAQALGVSTATSGESAAVQKLHLQRLKLVGVCQKCGAEVHRVRRLNRNRIYTHNGCGGEIHKV